VLTVALVGVRSSSLPAAAVSNAKIQHVVIIYQENHSFDNVLGPWCVQQKPLRRGHLGKTLSGATIALKQAADVVPNVGHSNGGQIAPLIGARWTGSTVSRLQESGLRLLQRLPTVADPQPRQPREHLCRV